MSGRRQLTRWQCYQRLGTFSFINMVFLVAISWAHETPAVAALLNNGQFEPTDSQLEIFSLQGTTPRHFLQIMVQTLMTDSPTSPDILPPANLPFNQGGVVKVPPVNRPEAILPSTAPPMTPPTVFPTNQTPTLSVPTLEAPSAQAPTPLTTSKPLEGSFRRISPAISPVPVIEFGQPLPKTIRAKPVPKLQINYN